MDIAVLGIDLGKTVCSLAGIDDHGERVAQYGKAFQWIDNVTKSSHNAIPPILPDVGQGL